MLAAVMQDTEGAGCYLLLDTVLVVTLQDRVLVVTCCLLRVVSVQDPEGGEPTVLEWR